MNPPENATEIPLGDGATATVAESPTDLHALRDAVARHVGAGQAIYPQGGRTALHYGGTPRTPGVAIQTTGLSRVIDYPAADMTITVEAGMTLAALQEVLAIEGQRLPLDAPLADRATLGGIYATNTSGPRRFRAGRPRDMIIGVGFVTADGELIKGGGRVVKNVAGYDFPKLLTGSMGTLGIIAELTLTVRPKPEASAIGWVALDRAEDAADVLDRLNTSRTRPIAVELLNRKAAEAIGGGCGLPASDWVIAVGLEDNAASVRWQRDALGPEVQPGRLEIVEGVEAEPVWRALAEFAAAETGPLSLVASLKPSAVVELASQPDAESWAIQAHAGSGVVHFHRLDENAGLNELAPVVNDLRHRAAESGGNLILSRCPTIWKERLRVWGEPRGDWALMEQVKNALDPGGVMNPGRFVGTIG